MAVGRGSLEHRLAVIRHMEENAVQIIARFLGRDREARLVDDRFQRFRRQFELRRQFAFGNDREIVARQRAQRESSTTCDDR